MAQVAVAYAEGDAEVGEAAAAALEGAGLEVARSVGAPSLKADKTRFDAAAAVVLVWSRRAAGEPGLRREAAAAAARGRLALARLDGAQPPPSLRTRLSFSVARTDPARGLRSLARAVADRIVAPSAPRKISARTSPMTADDASGNERSTWKGTLLLGVLLAGLAWSAAWLALGGSPAPLLMTLLKH